MLKEQHTTVTGAWNARFYRTSNYAAKADLLQLGSIFDLALVEVVTVHSVHDSIQFSTKSFTFSGTQHLVFADNRVT